MWELNHLRLNNLMNRTCAVERKEEGNAKDFVPLLNSRSVGKVFRFSSFVEWQTEQHSEKKKKKDAPSSADLCKRFSINIITASPANDQTNSYRFPRERLKRSPECVCRRTCRCFFSIHYQYIIDTQTISEDNWKLIEFRYK